MQTVYRYHWLCLMFYWKNLQLSTLQLVMFLSITRTKSQTNIKCITADLKEFCDLSLSRWWVLKLLQCFGVWHCFCLARTCGRFKGMFEVLTAMLLGCNAVSLSDSTNNRVAFFLNSKQFMTNSQYFAAMAVLHGLLHLHNDSDRILHKVRH